MFKQDKETVNTVRQYGGSYLHCSFIPNIFFFLPKDIQTEKLTREKKDREVYKVVCGRCVKGTPVLVSTDRFLLLFEFV